MCLCCVKEGKLRNRKNRIGRGVYQMISSDFPISILRGSYFMCGKHTVDSIFEYFIAEIQFIDLAIGARYLSVHSIDKTSQFERER